MIIQIIKTALLPDNLLKYCSVGMLGAIIDFLLFTSLSYYFHIYYLVSNIISFIVALFLVYYLQKNWTFQHFTSNNLKTFKKFLLVVIITFILNNILLIICVELFNIGLLTSKVIQILISLAWGYYANNNYVFCKD